MTSDRASLLNRLLPRLGASEARLAATAAAMTTQEHAAPSLLPGWTRAHVLAHLTLNAEGLGGAVAAALEGRDQPMYASPEARDADIAELAHGDPARLPERLARATDALAAALGGIDDAAAGRVISRTPGSDRTFLVGEVPQMRWGEVEIHHADLGSSYSPGDWPDDFTLALLDRFAGRAADAGFTAHASDLDRTWHCGADTPLVTGRASDLAWWLTGRGTGEGLTSDDGVLPEMEAW